MGTISETVGEHTYKFNRNTVENLTAKAEAGEAISNELNAMEPEERLAAARCIDRVNAAHRKADQNIPDLIIEEMADQDKKLHLFDIQHHKPKATWNPANPQNIDVYDLPQSVADLNVERALPRSMQSDRWKLILTYDKAVKKQ